MTVKQRKALVCLFFIALLLLGLFTVSDYGRSWDELGEMRIFRMALMEYGEALPFETGFHQALGEMGIIPLSQSVEMDHNFSLYYPIAWAACDGGMSQRDFTVVWRAQTWLIFTLGLFSLYAICRRMGLNRALSCAGVLLLLFCPRFFADGHYNNKDIALMTAVGLSLWQTLRLAEKPCLPRALLFSLAAGLCVNTRIIGGAVCALCGGMLVARLCKEKRLDRRALGVGAFTLAASCLVYALLTPALLRDPAGYLDYVLRNSYNFTRWNGTVLFMGQEISLAEGKPPFYYLPVNILLTTPLLQLALTAVGLAGGMIALGKKRLNALAGERSFATLLSALLWVLPLLCAVLLRVRVYNGWRHFYFLCLPMMATAAKGLFLLWQRWRKATAVSLAAILLAQGALLWQNHPFQYAYYNALAQRDTLETRYELDYWNLSVCQALERLLKYDPSPVVRVFCTDSRTRSGYAMATTYLSEGDAERLTLTDDPDGAYLLANTSYSLMAGAEIPAEREPVVAVEAYGATLCTIYQ